jgi:signal transduction histidine kinase
LEKCRQQKFDLVITDLNMPELTGHELLVQLKTEQPDVEVIVITGQGTIELAVQMIKAGAFDFITKPINFDHAELVVRKCLDQAAARAENSRLRQINRDLETLNEIKAKFIAITNHELRTPVSIISHVVELITSEFPHAGPRNLMRMLHRSTQQLREIVEQMHDISQINSPDLVLDLVDFPLKELFLEVKEELGLVLERRQLRLLCEVPEQLSIRADRGKFKKVIRELLQNAIKFTGDAGTICMAARFDGQEQAVLTFSDNGTGIAKEDQDKIFQLFYEVGDHMHHFSSKEDYLGGGMGLGLSIVNDIVKAHGGKVTVDSSPDEGSTFIITLPQHPTAVSS